jgi:hypothetical protein
LKPDAPEFFPRHLRAHTEAAGDPTRGETKQQTKERHKTEKDRKKHEKEERKSHTALVKKATMNACGQVGQLSGWFT